MWVLKMEQDDVDLDSLFANMDVDDLRETVDVPRAKVSTTTNSNDV